MQHCWVLCRYAEGRGWGWPVSHITRCSGDIKVAPEPAGSSTSPGGECHRSPSGALGGGVCTASPWYLFAYPPHPFCFLLPYAKIGQNRKLRGPCCELEWGTSQLQEKTTMLEEY